MTHTRDRADRLDDPREFWHLVATFGIVLGREAATAKEAGESFEKRARAGDFEAWTWLLAFLAATGTASRLLWLSEGDKRRQGRLSPEGADAVRARLREIVAERVPNLDLLRSRTLRDHFEHIDERIELWWMQSQGGTFVDGVLARRDGSSTTWIARHASPNALRSILVDELKVYLRGQEFDVRPVLDVVAAVASVADEVVREALRRAGGEAVTEDQPRRKPTGFGASTWRPDSNADRNGDEHPRPSSRE